jgi:hypothetical protein
MDDAVIHEVARIPDGFDRHIHEVISMGVDYSYVNFTKRERLEVDALGGGSGHRALGRTLASRAFQLLLIGMPGGEPPAPGQMKGRWAGDSVAIVGDTEWPDWEQFKVGFADLEANAILMVFRADGFEELGGAAEASTPFFMELCHLVATRQALELERDLKKRFGDRFLHRYKELCAERNWHTPKDMVSLTGGSE